MKNTKTQKNELYEVIIPLGGEGSDALFDDCPICQELKRQLASGEVEAVPIQWEGEADG